MQEPRNQAKNPLQNVTIAFTIAVALTNAAHDLPFSGSGFESRNPQSF